MDICTRWTLLCLLGLVVLLAGCGHSAASAADCSGNVAVVDGSPVTKAQYNRLLSYTLGYFERGDSRSPYFGKKICGSPGLRPVCRRVKSQLLQRMIDQAIVSRYAEAHKLTATGADWTRVELQEARLAGHAGGEIAFLGYLKRIGTDQAQFRVIEGEEIETHKVEKSMGGLKLFKTWLTKQESSGIVRCGV